jgi:Na+/H+ antiporter NhaB
MILIKSKLAWLGIGSLAVAVNFFTGRSVETLKVMSSASDPCRYHTGWPLIFREFFLRSVGVTVPYETNWTADGALASLKPIKMNHLHVGFPAKSGPRVRLTLLQFDREKEKQARRKAKRCLIGHSIFLTFL